MKRIIYVVTAMGIVLAVYQSCKKDDQPTTPPTIYTKVEGTIKDVDGNGYDIVSIIPVDGVKIGVPVGNNATFDTTGLRNPAVSPNADTGSCGTIISPMAQLIPNGIATLSANLKSEHSADGKPLVSTQYATLGGSLDPNGTAGSVTTGGTAGNLTTTEATMGGTSGGAIAKGAPAKSCYNNSSLNCDSIGALYTNEAATGMTFEQLVAWNKAQKDTNADGYIDLPDDKLNQPANAATPYTNSLFIGTSGEGLWVKNAVVQKGPQGACPQGYHIPTDGEWKQLEMSLGMPKYDVDKEGIDVDRGAITKMGNKLSIALGLKYGGYTSINTTFAQLDEVDIFWTSTAGIDKDGRPFVYVRYIYKNQFKGIIRKKHYEKSGLSVRCFKDL